MDELSRAITIIAHGLERFVRDKNGDKENQSSRYKELDVLGIGREEGGRHFGFGEEKLEIIEKKNEDRMLVADKLDQEVSSSSGPKSGSGNSSNDSNNGNGNGNSSGGKSSGGKHVIKSGSSHYNVTISSNNQMSKMHHLSTTKSIANSKSQLHRETRDSNSTLDSMTEYHKKLLSAHSTCSGPSDSLSERRGDLLYQ